MAIGPVEYVTLGLSGNRFNGRTPRAREARRQRDDPDLDLVFMTKDAAGNVGAIAFVDHEDLAPFAVAELEPNSSVAQLIGEDVWAMRASIRCATGGLLIEDARIPHDTIDAAEAEVAAAR